MSHNPTRHLLHTLRLAPGIVFALVVTVPVQYVDANSQECTVMGNLGDTTTCINVKNKGLDINSVKGSFTKPKRFCNWRYDIVYTDINGLAYKTHEGPTHSGCKQTGNFTVTYNPPFTAETGEVCAQLFENDTYRKAACVSILP